MCGYFSIQYNFLNPLGTNPAREFSLWAEKWSSVQGLDSKHYECARKYLEFLRVLRGEEKWRKKRKKRCDFICNRSCREDAAVAQVEPHVTLLWRRHCSVLSVRLMFVVHGTIKIVRTPQQAGAKLHLEQMAQGNHYSLVWVTIPWGI